MIEGLNAAGNTVGAEARFTVETFSAGRGDLDITVVNPDGQQEKVRISKTYSATRLCTYHIMVVSKCWGLKDFLQPTGLSIKEAMTKKPRLSMFTRAVLSQENRAMQRVIPTPIDSLIVICFWFRKGQGR